MEHSNTPFFYFWLAFMLIGMCRWSVQKISWVGCGLLQRWKFVVSISLKKITIYLLTHLPDAGLLLEVRTRGYSSAYHLPAMSLSLLIVAHIILLIFSVLTSNTLLVHFCFPILFTVNSCLWISNEATAWTYLRSLTWGLLVTNSLTCYSQKEKKALSSKTI